MFNRNIDNLPEHWEVSYLPTSAILTVVAGNVSVPDQGSTFVLLTLRLLWSGDVSATLPWTFSHQARLVDESHKEKQMRSRNRCNCMRKRLMPAFNNLMASLVEIV